ncbi:transcription elongation factor GreA [Patescibacteria group bacterium]|nr:transcription elongation factor GreA [Patescibacteria group bacterium]MBU1563467.1 transcription elongation factor GreA [Patescibacteria group bacterium]MBU2068576.1 transcription elongation factor GreA [Patescibacteria group bacterium]
MKYISPEGLEKLKKELVERQTEKRKEIAQRLDEAKSLGDLSENAEYSSAKEAQSFNETRILELEGIVKEAAVLKPARKGQSRVKMGAIIEVKLINGNSSISGKQIFMIVGSQEASPGDGKISNESPLGQAFLDREIGDIIDIETPKGKVKYKIVGIK